MKKIYLEILRLISCLAVIMFHISGLWNQSDIQSRDYIISRIYILMTDFMIPVFVMISGSLFLSPEKRFDEKRLWSKNILKLVIIYFSWSLVYIVINKKVTDISCFFDDLVKGHYHLWFIPMLVGLYIITPLLRPIVSNRKDLFYFLGISAMMNVGILIMYKIPCMTNIYGFIGKLQIHFFGGWIFYYVLGYAIDSVDINKKCRVFIYFGALISQLIAIAMLIYYIRQGEITDYIFNDYSINRCLYASAIFIFVKSASLKIHFDTLLSSAICRISSLTLGVYLIHAAVIEARWTLHFALDNRNPLWAVPCMTLTVVLLSFMIAWVLKRVPIVKKWLL